MARKVRLEKKEEESEEVFVEPKFDKREFIEKELSETKPLFISVLSGLIIGIISGAITISLATEDKPLNGALFGGVAFFIGFVLVRIFFSLLKVDVSKYKPQQWLGHIAGYFFTWLTVFIILINPPFADLAYPTSSGIEISYSVDSQNWTIVPSETLNISSPIKINVTAYITDNMAIKEVLLIIRVNNYDSNPVRLNQSAQGKYSHLFDHAGNAVYKFSFIAYDTANHKSVFTSRELSVIQNF